MSTANIAPSQLDDLNSSQTTELPSASPESVLSDVFGYDEFRIGQREVIQHTLQGGDSLVLLPTGGGKSLCYQIPALMLPGLTVVVSPLISLMQDQVEQLKASGVSAAYINSSLSREQLLAVYQGMQASTYSLIYVAPERLLQPAFIERLQSIDVSLFAVDEAHCVSHWGHDFRQDYRHLGQLKHYFPDIPIMGLTATADITTRADIQSQLQLNDPLIFRGSFDRPNIRYNLLQKYKAFDQLVSFLEQQDGSGIIYCNSRRKVDDVTQKLAQRGFNCAGYHAGLETPIRDKLQRDFQRDHIDIMVATVAFGMGINKSNVRFVVHYDLPRSVEGYYQETGRAGRDGMPSEALLMFDEKDAVKIKQWITSSDNSERQEIELQKFAAMENFAEAQTCRRQVLLNYFSEYTHHTCGNCDICLDPPKLFDATDEARQLLSCLLRLNQEAGMQHLIDVFRGKQLKRITDAKQHLLSTFGLGKDKSDNYWHNILNQLIHQGYLRIDITRNGMLKLTESSRPLLKGEVAIQLAVPRLALTKKSKDKFAPRNYDKALFAKLKHLRKQIAEEDEVPPFVVFSDTTLADMATQLPQSSADFLSVSGVGQTKLERYGERFLDAINTHLAS